MNNNTNNKNKIQSKCIVGKYIFKKEIVIS